MPLLATKHFLFQASDDGGSLLHNLGPIMLFFGRNALTFGRGTTCSLTFIAPVGFGAQQAGVFWLLEEEILHKERRDFVRRQNRGVRKICRGKRRKSPDRSSFTSWPKAGMLLMGGLLTLCRSLRKHNDNSPIP